MLFLDALFLLSRLFLSFTCFSSALVVVTPLTRTSSRRKAAIISDRSRCSFYQTEAGNLLDESNGLCVVFLVPVAFQRSDSSTGKSILFLNPVTMKMIAVVWIFVSLLLISHFSRGEKPSDDSVHSSHMVLVSTQSLASLLLLVLTAVLSGGVYLWILRYVCIGCCQPVPVGIESEALAGVV